MTEETKHIYIFFARGGVEKYSPLYDEKRSVPFNDYFDVGYGRGVQIDTKGMNLVFECERVRTAADEKRLHSHDILQGGPGMFIFVNDIIMSCLSHLVDKDIQVLPAQIYTQNGLVKGYHLIDIIPVVYGVDHVRSTYSRFTGILDKLVPKNEDFMEGHELAREDELMGEIYIIPELREKILKAKKGKLKGLALRTTKEHWDAGHNTDRCPY